MLVPAIVEMLAGLIIVWVAVRLWQGRVARGSAAGVRTPSTMRNDAAFETANKAAAPLAGAGGAIMAVGGVLAAVMPRRLFGVFVFGGVGLFLLLILLGAAVGCRRSCPAPGPRVRAQRLQAPPGVRHGVAAWVKCEICARRRPDRQGPVQREQVRVNRFVGTVVDDEAVMRPLSWEIAALKEVGSIT